MYRVIKYFTDLQDNNHAYRVGDIYPRVGFAPSEKRVKELLSGENRRKVKLIEEVPETPLKGEESPQNEPQIEEAEEEQPVAEVEAAETADVAEESEAEQVEEAEEKEAEKKPAKKKKTKEG
jgi:hypothetical protein